VLVAVRGWVEIDGLDPLKQFDDFDLLRFCRARKFQVAAIKVMFLNFLAMRKQHHLDTIIEDFEYPELPEVRKYFDFCCHSIDKLGRPVYVEKMGTVDIPNLLRVTT
jgi:CRAL/TRIO, N-terminal domain